MFKSNLIAGMIGIVLVCVFLGILITWIKAVPIVIIMLGVIAMMIYDFVKTLREGNGISGG